MCGPSGMPSWVVEFLTWRLGSSSAQVPLPLWSKQSQACSGSRGGMQTLPLRGGSIKNWQCCTLLRRHSRSSMKLHCPIWYSYTCNALASVLLRVGYRNTNPRSPGVGGQPENLGWSPLARATSSFTLICNMHVFVS